MKLRIAANVFLIGLGLAAIFFILQADRHAQTARVWTAALTSRMAALQNEIELMDRRLAAERTPDRFSERSPAKNAPGLGGVMRDDGSREAEPAIPVESAEKVRRVTRRTLIADDPVRATRFAQAARDFLEARHAWLVSELGLSPEKVREFLAMKAECEEAMRELAATADAHGLARDDRVYLALWNAEAERRVKMETEVMGTPEALAKYNEFNRTAASRDVAMTLAAHAVYAEVPLSARQVERLTTILARSSERFSDGRVIPGTVNWENATLQAARELSPAQLRVWQGVRQAAALEQEFGRRIGEQPEAPLQDLIRKTPSLPKVPSG